MSDLLSVIDCLGLSQTKEACTTKFEAEFVYLRPPTPGYLNLGV